MRYYLFGRSGPAAKRTQPIQRATPRDGNQPGEDSPARVVKVRRPPPNLQKRLLQHVLRLWAVMYYT